MIRAHARLFNSSTYASSAGTALREQFVNSAGTRQVLVFPDECHGIGAYANQLTAAEATRAFFWRHLVRADAPRATWH